MASEPIHDRTRRLEQLLLTREIEAFLYTEAELLDTRRQGRPDCVYTERI